MAFMKRIKYGTLLIIISLLVTIFSQVAFSNNDIIVKINGKQLSFSDTSPIIQEGRTLVPVRAIAEGLNAQVEWKADTSTVLIYRRNTYIKLQIDNKAMIYGSYITVSGQNQITSAEAINLDVAPEIINGSTMVPFRAIVETLGASVSWDDSAAIINITDNSITDSTAASVGRTSASKGTDNGAGNNINSGYVCNADDGYVYYCNVSDGGKLYRTKNDGSNKEKLNDDASTSIVVANGSVYYRNHSDGGKIYRIDTDGKNRMKLNDDNSCYVNVYNDCVYYVNCDDNNKIYCVKTDGTDRKNICDDPHTLYLTVSDGYVYYYSYGSTNKIFRIQTDGKDKQTLYTGYASNINVADGYIYYEADNNIYRIKTDGTDKRTISDDFPGEMNVYGGYIYYLNVGDNSKLYRMKIDGAGKQKLSDDLRIESIDIAAGRIYYLTHDKAFTVRTLKYMLTDGTGCENMGTASEYNFDTNKKGTNNTVNNTTQNPSTSSPSVIYVNCSACGGSGRVTCVICKGVGYTEHEGLRLGTWQKYVEPCIYCGGLGSKVCAGCGGSGKIAVFKSN
jgi:DnaJ-class molecular chaperone with C-terminal Zn finger domain